MVIGLIASPEVPPLRYGGTELFIANLAVGIKDLGHEVVVYANRKSKLSVGPVALSTISLAINRNFSETLKEINHTAWARRRNSNANEFP